MDRSDDADALYDLLSTPRRIAMVGASAKPDRPSYGVFRRLQAAGHRVVPVNPGADEVLGVPTVPDLAAAREVLGHIDVVDVFRRPEHVPDVVDAALGVEASWLWLQLGVVHETATQKALEGGMEVVVDRCMAIEQNKVDGAGRIQADMEE